MRRNFITYILLTVCCGTVAVSPATAAALSGAIDGLTVLDISGSPYSVTGDVYVGAGDTLVINPGVELVFDAGSDDQFGGLSVVMGEIYLEAGGVLLAEGTGTDGIILKSGGAMPSYTDYYGIVVAGDGCRVSLAYVTISDPYYGIYADNTDSCGIVLEHSTVLAPYMGVYCSNGGTGQSVTVDSCRIALAAAQGVYLYETPNVHLHASAVDSTDEDAIHVEGSGCDTTVRIIGNSLVCSNSAKNGINVKSAYPLVRDNDVSGGWASNLYLNSAGYDLVVSGNTLTDGIYGIFITTTGAPVLRDNALDGAFYLVFNQSAYDIDARNNWWGASVTAEMNGGGNPKDISGIYDSYDAAGPGTVAYAGWLASAGGDPVHTSVTGSVVLTDAAGDSVLVFGPGDTARARVTDADLDADSGAVETLSVYFTSAAETVPETVLLVETDTASGVFTGGIAVDTGTVGGDGVLQLERGGEVTVTYADAADEYGEASYATDAVVFGITLVSGGIEGAVTWTAAESPYLVTGDIIVSTADTLVVEPGVTVYFNAGSDDQNTGSDLNVSEIFVNGTGHLHAVGTADDSIVFTSYASVPDAGDWAALYVNGNASMRLGFCRVSYANYGVQTSFRTSLTDSVVVGNCRFDNVNRGVYLYQNQGAVRLEGNHFYKTAGNGVYAGYCHRAVVTGNRFDTTGNTAVYVYNAYGIDTALVITDNQFFGSGGSTGLYVRNSRPLVRNNRIENYGTGISLALADSTLSTDFEIILNDIIDGSVGIATGGYAAPSLRLNNIYGQSLRHVDNQSARGLDARYNWWGNATAETLAAGQHPRNLSVFLDAYDNAAYGAVDYGAWLGTLVGSGAYIYSAGADTATEEAAFTYTARAADRDNATVVDFSPLPGWLTQDGATVSGTPDDGDVDTVFTVYANDGETADSIEVTVVVVAVNDVPVITTTDPETLVRANEAYAQTVQATDADGEEVCFSLLAGPAGMTVDELTGDVAWLPDAGAVGTHAVGVEVCDIQGTYDTLMWSLTVLPAVTAGETVDTLGVYGFDGIGISAEFVALTGSGAVQATVHADSFPPDLPGGAPVKRFFTVTAESTISGMTVVLTFSYDQAEFDASDIGDETTLYAARWNGSGWEPYPSVVDTAANTVSCTTAVFSLWSIGGEGGSVPVELSAFTADAVDGGVQLSWTTESERDNYGFNVLRSDAADGDYVMVNGAVVGGAGNSSLPQAYAFTDADAGAGTWYYRLEMVALDGSREYSDVVSVTAQVSGILRSGIISRTAAGAMVLYDLNGRPVRQQGARSGIYLLHQNKSLTKVIVK